MSERVHGFGVPLPRANGGDRRLVAEPESEPKETTMYEPPAPSHTGSSLHESVVAAITARGGDPDDKAAYLAEAAAQSEAFTGRLNRPLDREPTPHEIRQAVKNEIGEQAAKNLGAGFTAEQYLREIERLNAKLGRAS